MRNIKKIKFLILSKILILFFCFICQTNAGTTSKRKERESSNLISFQTAKKQKTGKSTKNVYTITVEQQLGLLNECKSLKPYEFQYLLKIYVGKINSNEGHKITEDLKKLENFKKYYDEKKGKIDINVKSYFELKQSMAENEEDKKKNQTRMESIRQDLNKTFILYINYLKKREIVNLVVKNFVNEMDKKVKNKYLKLEENQKKFYKNGNNIYQIFSIQTLKGKQITVEQQIKILAETSLKSSVLKDVEIISVIKDFFSKINEASYQKNAEEFIQKHRMGDDIKEYTVNFFATKIWTRKYIELKEKKNNEEMEKAKKELAKYSQKVKNGETIFLFKQCFDVYNSTIGKNKQNTEAIQGKGKNFVDFPGKNQNVPSLQHENQKKYHKGIEIINLDDDEEEKYPEEINFLSMMENNEMSKMSEEDDLKLNLFSEHAKDKHVEESHKKDLELTL